LFLGEEMSFHANLLTKKIHHHSFSLAKHFCAEKILVNIICIETSLYDQISLYVPQLLLCHTFLDMV